MLISAMKRRLFNLAAAVSLAGFGLLLTRCASAEVRYTVTDLGDLGQHSSDPYALNNVGQAVGVSFAPVNQRHAFLHDGSKMIDLTASSSDLEGAAFGLNDHGQVVGYHIPTDGGLLHGFIWSADTGMRDLGTLGGNNSHANAINNAGQVVGDAVTSEGADHAFLWTASAGMQDLGALSGTSQAYAINDRGQVAGFTGTPAGFDRAFVWSAGTGMVALGTLGGRHSWAYGINNNGQVVGWGATAEGDGNQHEHAFVWSPSSGITDLGTLGGYSSESLAVNDDGLVVGDSYVSMEINSELHAFLWDGSAMRDLNTLIDPGSGWVLKYARGINNSGQIIAAGINLNQPWLHAVLLSPIPEPIGLPSLYCWVLVLLPLRLRRSRHAGSLLGVRAASASSAQAGADGES